MIWIYGRSGAGKTSLAKEYAANAKNPCFMSGSTRGSFEGYNGEHTVILDEFRPDTMHYQDLLRILDPFGEQVMAPSRYHDKAISCDLIIITSPYSPMEYYNELFGYCRISPIPVRTADKTDRPEQLLRRISLTIEVNEDFINSVEYDAKSYTYKMVSGASARKNPYSERNRPTPPCSR